MEQICLQRIRNENSQDIESYLAHDGYAALRKALTEMTPEAVHEEVRASNMGGRGGAGFPTAMKWNFLVGARGQPKYVLCNFDESEPGTFSNRIIGEEDPHLLVEGCLLAAYATGCSIIFIYIRGEYFLAYERVKRAIEQAYARGLIGKNILGTDFSVEMHLRRGAGAYICGEETAIMNSLEGKRGYPRARPPFPANEGLFGKPTLINNVETLSNLPDIVLNGGEWWSNLGVNEGAGLNIYCLSGHVERPGAYELPMGTTARELIYEHGGGVWQGRELKAWKPGGASSAILPADMIDLVLDFKPVQAAGTILGTAGVVVMDDRTCVVDAAIRDATFFEEESCGFCFPCRDGTRVLRMLLDRVRHGVAAPDTMDLIEHASTDMMDASFCGLGQFAPWPVVSTVRNFRREYESHILERVCPAGVCPMDGVETNEHVDRRTLQEMLVAQKGGVLA